MNKSFSYRHDRQLAREAAYKYANNPFEDGTRLARLYEKEKIAKLKIDSMFDDLETVYGSLGTKKQLIDNVPGTFSPDACV